MNGRSCHRAAAPDFTLTQHFARCERTQQDFGASGLGSLLPFAANVMKVRFKPSTEAHATQYDFFRLCGDSLLFVFITWASLI